jgi:hypothetical protein
LDIDEPEILAIETLGTELFEKRPVRVIENHAQADHAGP